VRGFGWLVGLTFACVVIAACSGSGGAKSADERLVAPVVLRATDFPGPWSQGRAVLDTKSSADAQFSRCLGIPNEDADETAFIGSPVLSQGGTHIFSSTYAYRSEAVVLSDVRGLNRSQLTRCLSDLFTGEGLTNVNLAREPLPTTAGSLTGVHVTGYADPPASSDRPQAVIDFVVLTKGRIETSIFAVTTEPRASFQGLMYRATAAIAERLDQAAG